MRFREDLVWSLAKIVNDTNCSNPLNRINNVVKVLGTMVGKMMEDVDAFDSSFSALFAAEDKIDPLMQVFAHVRTLQSFSVLGDENSGISFGPWWQLDSIDTPTITLSHPKIIAIVVGQKLWKVEELWDQLSNVSHVVLGGRLPRLLDGVEESIRMIETTSLEKQI